MAPDTERQATSTDATLPANRPRTTRDLAIAKLRTALQERPGYVVVSAESAAAAEALFSSVEGSLDTFRTVRARGPALDPESIVRSLWHDGEPPFPARLAMRTLIQEARQAERPIVVAITEADAADPAALERVRLTLEGTPDASEIVRLALLGGPALAALLRRPETRAIAMRIGASVTVPVAPAELRTATITPPKDPPPRVPPLVFVILAVALGVAGWEIWRAAATPEPAAEVAGRDVAPVQETPPEATAPQAAPLQPAPPVPAPEPVAAVAPAVVEDPDAKPAALATAPEPPAPKPVAVSEPTPVAAPTPTPTPTPAPTPPTAAPTPTGAPAAPTAMVAARPKTPAAAPAGAALQVGAFVRADTAEALRQKLEPQFPDVYVSHSARGGSMFHRVRVGGFRTEHDLEVAAAMLRTAGYAPIRVRE